MRCVFGRKTLLRMLSLLAAVSVPLADLSAQGINRNRLLNPALRARQNNANRRGAANAAAAAPEQKAMQAPGANNDSGGRSIEFNAAPVDMVFTVYQDLVGKTVLKDPQTPAATITLQPKKGQVLTDEEKIEAIETVLEMNGIHMEPYGEKFVRAIPRKEVRKDGIPLIMDSNAKLRESTRVVSLMLPFKNISLEDAQKALDNFKSASGIIIGFDRTNSLLLTDTEQNVNRMREIARAIDIANPVTEVVEYIQIKYASANDIKQVLDSIVQEAMKEQEKNGKTPQNTAARQATSARPLGGLLGRRGQQQQQTPANNQSLVMSVSDADRGMIRGKVVTIADERSNKILIITNQSNMKFFKDVIAALDVETTPDTVVKVYRLKYAEAEDVSDMINDLIGNSSSSKSGGKANQNQNSKKGTSGSVTRKTQTQTKKPANQRTGDVKAGELNKDNTTVLADKRINGIVVMTNKELVPTIEQIIESMDIKLSQVLIETVIIEVTLGKDINTGVDWISGLKSGGNQAMASGDKSGNLRTTSSTTEGTDVGALVTDAIQTVPAAQGIGYFANIKDLDISVIIQASKTDTRSKYLASPVIMTLDNKEATIDATTKQQFITGWQAVSSSYAGSGLPSPTYSSTDIGLKVKVTPKINPNGTVMLEVEEEYTQVAGKQDMLVPNTTSDSKSSYSTQQVEIPTTRKMSSDVLLENNQTVVFGGLVESLQTETDAGIPILKDIPYIGKWLFGKVEIGESRTELLVFMTPYVMDDGILAQREALRRKCSMSDQRPWEDNGWSASALADPISKKEQIRRIKDEWRKQDEDRKNRIALEQAKVERAMKLKEMSAEEREKWLNMHKEELEEEKQEELEKKMLDKDSQNLLKKLVEEVKAKKLSEAEKALKQAEKESAQLNERAKLDAEKKEKQEAKDKSGRSDESDKR